MIIKLLGVLWLGICLSSTTFARPVDLSAPQNRIGAANLRGHVEIWREVDEIDLGKGVVLPLRFKFSSERGVKGILGEGFWCPLVESHALLIRPRMMKVSLPCGKVLYMRMDRKERKKFRTLDHQWEGALEGTKYRVSRDDGWALEYVDGRLVSMITDDGRKIRWSFNGSQPSGIFEGANRILNIEVHENEIAMSSGIKRHRFYLGNRPNFSLVQQKVILNGFTPALDRWKTWNQRDEHFAFSLTDEKAPKLVFSDQNKKETIYSWDAKTGFIQTENDWKYKVTPSFDRFGVPTISRINSNGSKEGIDIDNSLGIYTRLHADGSKTVTHTDHEPGPNYGKIIKRIRQDKGTDTVLYSAAYNQLGNLVKEVDEKGFSTTYEYDEEGSLRLRLISPPVDPVILDKLSMQERELLAKVESAQSQVDKGNALQTLGFFYIHEAGQPQKALALIADMKNPQQILNLKLHAIENDYALDGFEKSEALAKLLAEHPKERETLEFLIDAWKQQEIEFAKSVNSIKSK